MAHSDVLRRVKRAYERPHLHAAARALVVAGLLIVIAIGLYRVTRATYLVAIVLATTMAVFAWRGGSWRRGAFAGVLAGLPPLIIPSIAWTLFSGAGHCTSCEASATMPCLIACFGTGSLVGILVGYRSICDSSPRRYGLAAMATAALGGLLGCGTTGLGGATGIVLGLVAGGVAGWRIAHAGRTAHV
jgi:MFS superfamily sulfate permease-like transporter